jgi:hypothetical protein
VNVLEAIADALGPGLKRKAAEKTRSAAEDFALLTTQTVSSRYAADFLSTVTNVNLTFSRKLKHLKRYIVLTFMWDPSYNCFETETDTEIKRHECAFMSLLWEYDEGQPGEKYILSLLNTSKYIHTYIYIYIYILLLISSKFYRLASGQPIPYCV